MAKVIMNWEIYGEEDRVNLEEECADILFSLVDIANAYGLDLDESCERKLKQMDEKIPKWKNKYANRLHCLRKKFD